MKKRERILLIPTELCKSFQEEFPSKIKIKSTDFPRTI
jgi:hypothetical protein